MINTSIEEKISKKSENWWDKINNFFDRIEFINLSPELKEEVAIKVKDWVITWNIYWIQIFLSSIIATLWLLQNSVAVVIWAMLISPLLRPINWISYSISKWERALFWASLRILVFSMFIAIFLWYISAIFVWLSYETNEILSRTSPNILDLFIAIFSAMIAVLALWFNRFWWESIAWVAMAASLMPPLEIIWIEIYFGNLTWAYWAMMLFLTNLVAIIFVWIVIFRLYWFTPNTWDRQKVSMETFIFIVLVVFTISIPLFQSLVMIKEKSEIRKDAKVYLEGILKKENSQISISNLEVDSIKDDNILINSTIKLPEWINFYDTFKKQLDFELTKKLGKNVELNIDLIRIANIVSSSNISNTETKIYDQVSKEFIKSYSKYNLISLEVNKNNNNYSVKLILWIKDQNFDSGMFIGLENKIRSSIKWNVEFSYVPLSIHNEKKLAELTYAEKNKLEIEKEFKNYLDEKLSNGINIKEIKVDLYNSNKTKINLIFEVENSSIIEFTALLSEIRKFSNSKNIDLEVKFYTFKDIDMSNYD